MRRSLFSILFLRIALLLAVFAIATRWLPRPWLVALSILGILLAAGVARWTVSSIARSTTPLENTAASILIPSKQNMQPGTVLRDFEALAQALATASHQVQKTLRASDDSRQNLEALLDSMQDAVVAVDAAGRILWTNQRMQRLMQNFSSGQPASSAVRIGQSLVHTIRDPDVLEAVRSALEQSTSTQRRSSSLLPGSLFEVNASPMPAGGAVAVLHDITRVEEVERTQRDFVANVSHELRTPLTSITGYVETLLDHEENLSAAARSFLEIIHKNATRMNRLTEDLLVMARVERSQALSPTPQPSDLLIRDAVQSMSGLIQESEAILEVGSVTSCEVLADHDAILQVLANLIENAIKYGHPRSAVHSHVIVSSREVAEPHPAVEFSVRDFGEGISSEHLSRIFERFYRVDKARSRESGGTGLGLAIARHIIQLQGGAIWAESELNAGTNFLFTLPVAERAVS